MARDGQTIWECYGHGLPGVAVVAADNRARAIQAAREWLGWDVVVAFRATDREIVWQNCGGTQATPVVYAADGEQFERVERKRA